MSLLGNYIFTVKLRYSLVDVAASFVPIFTKKSRRRTHGGQGRVSLLFLYTKLQAFDNNKSFLKKTVLLQENFPRPVPAVCAAAAGKWSTCSMEKDRRNIKSKLSIYTQNLHILTYFCLYSNCQSILEIKTKCKTTKEKLLTSTSRENGKFDFL